MDAQWCSLMVEQSPDALIVTREDGSIAYWNQGAASMFGYPADEVTGRALEAVLGQGLALGSDTPSPPATSEGDGRGVETVRRHKNGEPVYVNAFQRPMRDAHGHPVGTLHRYTDITPLKIGRDAHLVEQRYGALANSMPDAIVIVNDTGRILLFNRQAQALFGFTPEEILGRPIEALLPPRYRHQHVGHRNQYFEHSRTRPMGVGLELFGMRSNGAEFPVEISLSPLESEAGALVISAIRDITDRKNIERTLQDKNVELERASQAKDSFLATMSHELRTPLNAIIGFTGLMLMKLPGPLTADQERQLNAVQSSGKHLLSLINDLLDLAKIESGRVDITREPVVWQTVVRDVETTLRQAAEVKGLTFEVSVPPHQVVAETDGRALHQILLNLVNNAIKYTDRGRVQVELRQHRQIGVVRTEIVVTDTGAGIGPEDQARLFQAFIQVGNAPRGTEGTGLGLYLCRKLADLLGGRIDLESTVGVGSRFTFSITSRDEA